MLSEAIRTGIEGLDEMLGGGLPKGRTTLVVGGPGTGKSILSVQFLCNGVTKFNEKGVLVLLETEYALLKRDMLKLGLTLEKFEAEGKLKVVDHSVISYMPSEKVREAIKYLSMPVFKIASLLEAIKNSVREIDAKRLVLDSVSALTFQEPDPVKRRLSTMLIFKTLIDLGCTSLVVSEVKANQLEREFIFEEYLADGVIVLRNFYREESLVKGIHVEKMRSVAHDTQLRPYRISEEGVKVFPKEKLFISV